VGKSHCETWRQLVLEYDTNLAKRLEHARVKTELARAALEKHAAVQEQIYCASLQADGRTMRELPLLAPHAECAGFE
jgi:hypothetical protein